MYRLSPIKQTNKRKQTKCGFNLFSELQQEHPSFELNAEGQHTSQIKIQELPWELQWKTQNSYFGVLSM